MGPGSVKRGTSPSSSFRFPSLSFSLSRVSLCFEARVIICEREIGEREEVLNVGNSQSEADRGAEASAMISQLFVLSLRGDNIIFRDCESPSHTFIWRCHHLLFHISTNRDNTYILLKYTWEIRPLYMSFCQQRIQSPQAETALVGALRALEGIVSAFVERDQQGPPLYERIDFYFYARVISINSTTIRSEVEWKESSIMLMIEVF